MSIPQHHLNVAPFPFCSQMVTICHLDSFIGFPSRLPESTCQRIIFVKCQPDLVLSLSVAFSDPLWPSAGSSQSLKTLVCPSPVLLGAVASHLSAPPFPQPSPSFSCLTPTQPLRVSSESPFRRSQPCSPPSLARAALPSPALQHHRRDPSSHFQSSVAS